MIRIKAITVKRLLAVAPGSEESVFQSILRFNPVITSDQNQVGFTSLGDRF